jgi:uncharacterized protein (DUF362 family)
MTPDTRLSRRQFLHALGGAAAVAGASLACRALGLPEGDPTPLPTTSTEGTAMPTSTPALTPQPTQASLVGKVALVKTDNRAQGVRRALDMLGVNPVPDRHVFLKPNCNTADPAPASSHPDVLRALAVWLQDAGAASITLGDRSGMGDTRRVMERMGIFDLASELGLESVVFDELGADGWVAHQPPGSHWARGFAFARPALDAEAIVLACCLKTHRYGGHFTLSLKNAVGLVAKAVPGDGYDYMAELHSSPHQRRMIAEINAVYSPTVSVIDGVEAFVDGGPDRGTRVQAEVILAAVDRVALDAVGVAVLRHHGTTDQVSASPVFAQEQIARAVEIGLGVAGPEGIEFLTEDRESQAYAEALRPILLAA